MKHTITVNREVSVVKIALTGKMRSGKDTVANHLYIKYGFDRVAFGDALKKNAHAMFPWVSEFSKPRALYQAYGQLMRQIEPDVWIKHAERAVNGAIEFRVNTGAENVGVVITDLRQPNEYEWCRQNGFSIIRVVSDEDVRVKRALSAGDDFKTADLLHETEQHIDDFQVDYEIVNNSSIEKLQKDIDEIILKISGGNVIGDMG
jgi:dephospho-CoA kinase